MQRPGPDLDYAEPDEWITSGQKFELGTRTLEAIATLVTPTATWCSPISSAGLTFAGDHVLPHITPSISLEAAPQDLPLGDFLDSLRWSGSYPTCGCCPRTARSRRACTTGGRADRSP